MMRFLVRETGYLFFQSVKPGMYKILVIDRCHFSRSGLEAWLNHPDYFTSSFSIMETDDLLQARERILQWQPHMVIADFYGFLSEVHHVQQLSSIFSACGNTTRLILLQSGHSPQLNDYCAHMAVNQLAEKSISLPALSGLIKKTLISRPPFGEPKPITSLLTLREERILALWTKGSSNNVIAENMAITVKTVYTYKRNIRMKLGADNRFSLFLAVPEMLEG